MGPSMPAHSPSTAVHTPSTPAHTPSMPAHTPSMPAHSPSTAAHTPSMPAHSPSSPAHTPSMPAHTQSMPDHTPSMAAHSPFMTAHSPSDVGLDAPASPLHIPMHTDATIAPSTENPRSIDGKSTLHRRKIHAPSTPLITGSTPLLYPPKRLASPRLHLTLITVIVSPISFFSFSLAFCPINFPFAPRHQQPYPTAILPHSPSRSIALYLYISPSSSIYTVRASDSRFTSISLSLNAHKHAHTHILLLGKMKKNSSSSFSSFLLFQFFLFSFLNNQRQHCTRDIMNPSRRECIVCVDARMLHMPHTHKHTRICIYMYTHTQTRTHEKNALSTPSSTWETCLAGKTNLPVDIRAESQKIAVWVPC